MSKKSNRGCPDRQFYPQMVDAGKSAPGADSRDVGRLGGQMVVGYQEDEPGRCFSAHVLIACGR